MNTIDEGPCYLTNVYYDILDDDYGLWTIYRFTTKELAESFVEKVPFICSDIELGAPRTDDGHLETHPYRPIFDKLEDAIEDAKEFHKHGKDEEYKYSGRVFEVELSEIEKQYHINTIKSLKKENNKLKEKVAHLENQLKSVHSEVCT